MTAASAHLVNGVVSSAVDCAERICDLEKRRGAVHEGLCGHGLGTAQDLAEAWVAAQGQAQRQHVGERPRHVVHLRHVAIGVWRADNNVVLLAVLVQQHLHGTGQQLNQSAQRWTCKEPGSGGGRTCGFPGRK